MTRVIIVLLGILILSCESEKQKKKLPKIYKGPLTKLYKTRIIYSDSAIIKAEIKAAEILDFQNKDREIPKGIFITFYKKNKKISATFKANYAYFYKKKNLWKATGNVTVKNIENEETLHSEELYWNPRAGDIYTEKFVRIEKQGELMTGSGLKAKQDFTEWTLDNPEGIIEVDNKI